jgi:hypothetical protein
MKLKTSVQQKKWLLLKRPLTEWEKIFASYISDKGLINNKNIQGVQKTKLPKNQQTNEEVGN